MQASELRLVRPQAKEPGDGNGGQGRIEAPSSLRLSPAELRRRCDPVSLPFTSTSELEPLEGPVGQPRAIEALELAMAIAAPGYNAFVVGPHGMGKHAVLRALLERSAELKTAPSDWCYVHNFERPHEPSALELPHGRGRALAADMKKLIEELRVAIPAAFDSEVFRARVRKIEQEVAEKSDTAVREVGVEASHRGLALVRAEGTIGFAPIHEGRILGPNEFELLAGEEQARFKKDLAELHEQLRQRLSQLPQWAKQAREKLIEISREITELTVNVAMEGLVARHGDLPRVSAYLADVRRDIIENADDFREEEGGAKVLAALAEERPLQRYAVNLFIDHADSIAAPVVYADEPSVDDLLGRIEHRVWLGNMVSDFTLIKPGALHRANGGFLVVDALKILRMPHAWESLKRTLFTGTIRIEPLARMLGFSSSATLEPEPIPLDIKVVLVADHMLYALLSELDPEVSELFKVVAEFDDRIERDADGELCLARCVSGLVARDHLRPLDRASVARVIEQSSRRAGDSRKLSTGLRELETLLREADYRAGQRHADVIEAGDVEESITTRIRLRNLFQERGKEAIVRGKVLVDTDGAKIGQVNGLSVLQIGDYTFGRPTRITAAVRVGEGKVVDIEREVELGGPLHSKGVLILSSYLASRYTHDVPWSLGASLVFEQSYAGVEGDSASLAELCALLSAISGVPIKQSIAVTGSVNQLGRAQAVGGLNEKVEGFFDLCMERGLTGEQGVIVPKSNATSLMLREDVVEACAAGRFHVYAVETADEAIELLTGVAAGKEDEHGDFPEESVNGKITAQLLQFAAIVESFGKLVRLSSDEDEDEDDDD